MPPVYAAAILPGVDVSFDLVEFFKWTSGNLGDLKDTIWGNIWHLVDDDVCPSAPAVGGRHNFVERRTQINGQIGLYYVCEYCGKSAGEVAQQSYNDYVNTLPATVYDSSGRLSWKVMPDVYRTSNSDSAYTFVYSNDYASLRINSVPYRPDGILEVSKSWKAPVDGIYSFNLVTLESLSIVSCTEYLSLHSFDKLMNSGDVILNSSRSIIKLVFENSVFGYWYGYFLITCIPYFPPSGDSYSVITRPTTITGGNYGIVGDNGQITKIEDNRTIINETNNTYYNPATGKTETVNSWSYDYGDRSYTLTLGDGSTATVTYGDENITIIEGNVTYIIYYIIDGSGSGSGSGHTHEWYQTGAVQGNCLTPAQRTYTCSVCGKQYTETDPVLGHSWRIIQTVSTKYDDSGNLIQKGYTVYECERCGEQYKSTNDTGPPPSGGGGSDGDSGDIDDGGLLEWINGLIKYLSDHLSGAVELILSFFRTIPELFGGFLDFLSAMFPFLPDEIMLLLTFGIAAVVFVGIIKAIRR